MKIFNKTLTLQKTLPWLLIVAGTIGLICACVIGYDEISLLQNAHFQPNCDLNPVISCGSVMQSKQAHTFGIPNFFIGLVCFPIVITTGVVLLNGARLKRWYWLGLEGGTIFGLGFVHWLFFQTVYRIHALCPYCMVIWVMTIATFWYVTLYNIQTKAIHLKGPWQKVGYYVRRHHLDILVLWLLIIAFLILKHFWYYYGKGLHV